MSFAHEAANTSSMLLVAAAGERGRQLLRDMGIDPDVAIAVQRADEQRRKWLRLTATVEQRQLLNDQADHDAAIRADDWWITERNRSAE